MATPNSKFPAWVTFVGLILLLFGVYGSLRTAINLTLFEKYPATGVYVLNFMGMPYYQQREEDCENMPTIYPLSDVSSPIEVLSKEESIKEQEKQKLFCLGTVRESRSQAKINDISQSILFLFLGTGVMVSRKYIFA
ncbi:MAG: hypothetical protein AAB685_00955 [Patescibacteria group bacterium]